jgi:hypothetical protein
MAVAVGLRVTPPTTWGEAVKLNRNRVWALASGLLLVSCTLDDDSIDGPVFTCDASATVAEFCIEEPASPTTQEVSKSTCKSGKGEWSDTKRCPTSYTKKCRDGEKVQFFYAKDDASKSCDQLIGLILSPAPLAMSLEPRTAP